MEYLAAIKWRFTLAAIVFVIPALKERQLELVNQLIAKGE